MSLEATLIITGVVCLCFWLVCPSGDLKEPQWRIINLTCFLLPRAQLMSHISKQVAEASPFQNAMFATLLHLCTWLYQRVIWQLHTHSRKILAFFTMKQSVNQSSSAVLLVPMRICSISFTLTTNPIHPFLHKWDTWLRFEITLWSRGYGSVWKFTLQTEV